MMDEKIQRLLDHLIQDPFLHARWLNTLSFMEHVGTRKIHKTQSGPALTDIVLQHASEEARHALFFKKVAEKVSPGFCPNYEKDTLLAGYSAYRYFQSLDSMARKKFSGKKKGPGREAFLCYLYVTTLIEERAGWLYPLYEKALKSGRAEFSIDSIIREEEGHLKTMYEVMTKEDPGWESSMKEFREKEAELFDRLIVSVQEKAGLPPAG